MKLKKYQFKKVKSTNDVAIKKIKSGIKSGIVLTETQTKGRGQYGKKWISLKGNLLMSVFFEINWWRCAELNRSLCLSKSNPIHPQIVFCTSFSLRELKVRDILTSSSQL